MYAISHLKESVGLINVPTAVRRMSVKQMKRKKRNILHIKNRRKKEKWNGINFRDVAKNDIPFYLLF